MIRLSNETGINGQVLNSIQQSDNVSLVTVGASANTSITVPTGSTHVMYQYYGTDNLFVRQGGSAFSVLPVPPLDNQEMMVNPDLRQVTTKQKAIHAIAEKGGLLVISFYGG